MKFIKKVLGILSPSEEWKCAHSIDKFVSHLLNYEEEQSKLPWQKRDIFPVGTDAQMFADCMIECFLGDDWWTTIMSVSQVNTEACFEILYKHSRKFRKAIRKIRKSKGEKR